MNLQPKFAAVAAAMSACFVERADTVEAVLLAAIAQEHIVLLGPPGTAKSATIRALTSCVTGARLFDVLLTKFSTEDEVCGPAKLSALKQDRFERNVDGHLPGVEIAFLDETFKANSAVLNATLSITNERVYKGRACPLRFLAGASNEMPEDESLGAMFDRFLVRHVVDYVASEAAWIDMLYAALQFAPPVQITLDEWDQATAQSRLVKVPRPVIEEMAKIKRSLANDGIVVSDRRWIKALSILKAAAWLDGEFEVQKDHLWALRFVLWTKQDDRARVAAVLKTVDMGPARECQDLIDDALRAFDARPTDPAKYFDAIPGLIAAITAAAKRVKTYDGKLSKRATAKVAQAMSALKQAHGQLKADLDKRYSMT